MIFCRNVIVNYFAPLIKEPSIFIVVGDILNTYSQIYKTLGDASSNNLTHSSNGYLENNKVKWMNKVSAKALNRRTAQDIEWREKLQAGDYIDAICRYPTPNSSAPNKYVQAWQPAKIERLEIDGNLVVSFLRLPRTLN